MLGHLHTFAAKLSSARGLLVICRLATPPTATRSPLPVPGRDWRLACPVMQNARLRVLHQRPCRTPSLPGTGRGDRVAVGGVARNRKCIEARDRGVPSTG